MFDMFELFRKAALFGIGAVTLTEERARKLVNELVEQGRLSGEEGENLVKDLLSRAESSREEWETRVRDMIQDVFRKMDLVPRKDMTLLEQQVRSLELRVAELERRERSVGEEVMFQAP
jgi:polyhydroxyalkanoate synthesis regulator phasin